MDDIVKMKKLQTIQNAGNKELRFTLFEASATAHMISQIATNE